MGVIRGQASNWGGKQRQVGVQPIEMTTILPSNYETATDYTLVWEAEIETNRRNKNNAEENWKETERDDAAPGAISDIPQAGNKKRVRKQRLVSHSSQESASSQDETSSRRSGRKRTAVNKMGAVMIDNIQKVEKDAKK